MELDTNFWSAFFLLLLCLSPIIFLIVRSVILALYTALWKRYRMPSRRAEFLEKARRMREDRDKDTK